MHRRKKAFRRGPRQRRPEGRASGCATDVREVSGGGAIHQLPAAPKHGARGDTGSRSDIWSELPRRDVAIMSTALRCRQVRLGPAPTTNSVAPCLRHLAAAWGTPSGLRPSASATSLRSLSV